MRCLECHGPNAFAVNGMCRLCFAKMQAKGITITDRVASDFISEGSIKLYAGLDKVAAENRLLRRALVGLLEDISPAIDFHKDSMHISLRDYNEKWIDRLEVAEDGENIKITFKKD